MTPDETHKMAALYARADKAEARVRELEALVAGRAE